MWVVGGVRAKRTNPLHADGSVTNESARENPLPSVHGYRALHRRAVAVFGERGRPGGTIAHENFARWPNLKMIETKDPVDGPDRRAGGTVRSLLWFELLCRLGLRCCGAERLCWQLRLRTAPLAVQQHDMMCMQ